MRKVIILFSIFISFLTIVNELNVVNNYYKNEKKWK